MDHEVGKPLRQAGGMGRREHRRNAHVLPASAATPQTPEVDQYARAPERGAETPDARGAHLSECGELLTTGARAGRRDSRELDRGHAVPEHGSVARAQETATARGGVEGTGLWKLPSCGKPR